MPAPLDQRAEFAEALLDPQRDIPLGLITFSPLWPARKFAVCRSNVVVGLTEALKRTFPVVSRLVGDQFFRAMAREFIVKHPPHCCFDFLTRNEGVPHEHNHSRRD